jgi:hypothetical protein
MRRSRGWWMRCCWSKTSTSSSRTAGCSRPREWLPSPRCRKQPPEPTVNISSQPSGANWSSRDSHDVNNQVPSPANDLTTQSHGFIVNERGTHRLANGILLFTPVHSRIRVIEPRDIHLAKGTRPLPASVPGIQRQVLAKTSDKIYGLDGWACGL